MERQKELESLIQKNISSYSKGEMVVSDAEFDSWVEELTDLDEKSEVLQQVEDYLNGDYPKVTLPFHLYSQKKIKLLKDIKNWIESIQQEIKEEDILEEYIVITPKYDGIQILDNISNQFTRGRDGIIGQQVSSRSKLFKCFEKSNKQSYSFGGELIVTKDNFEKYFRTANYISARNFIPSLFSNDQLPKNLDKIDYMRYTVFGDRNLSKTNQLDICNEENKIKVPYVALTLKVLSQMDEEYFDTLFNYWNREFNIDGLIIELDSPRLREKLGYANKYPNFSRAYKPSRFSKDLKKSTILDIQYQISRYGKLTPVAKIVPVELNDGIVSSVSLYNAKYVLENNICIGKSGYVLRAGFINPKFASFEEDDKVAQLPAICPCCGKDLSWDSEGTDLYCDNVDCLSSKVRQIAFFLKKIGIKEVGEKTIQLFCEEGLLSIEDFLDSDKILNVKAQGIGDITKKSLIGQIKNLGEEGVELEKLQEASGLFVGIAEQSLKILNQVEVDLEYYYTDSYYNDVNNKLKNLENIGAITAETYLYFLPKFWDFYNKVLKTKVPILKNKVIKETKGLSCSGLSFCFSGFRDENLKSIILNYGGNVLSTTTSSCNCLIVKDKNQSTSKIERAKEIGIEILSIEEFQKRFDINI